MKREDGDTPKWSDIFNYSDGVLSWKVRAAYKLHIGDVAGKKKDDGYIRLKYKGYNYYAHRIVWEMHNGPIPDGMEVDHINHDRKDNRIDNLRLVSRIENCKNRKINSNNTSGCNGVSWQNREGKWLAYIYINRKRVRLGLFSDINRAISAREAANNHYRFHRNHGGKT